MSLTYKQQEKMLRLRKAVTKAYNEWQQGKATADAWIKANDILDKYQERVYK